MFVKLAALSLCLSSLAFQEEIKLVSGGNHVTISNGKVGNLDGFGSGNKESHAFISAVDGKLAELACPEKGFSTRGRELEFTWAELNSKKMEFRKGRIEGNASLIFDSEVSQQTLTSQAISEKKVPPAAPEETSFVQVDSERFSYIGNIDKGTITMPDPWTLVDTAKGSMMKVKEKVPYKVHYDQTFTASGSKGEIHLGKGPDGNLGKLETGNFEGPVHFKIVRNETPDGAGVTEKSTYTGVADHLELDLTTTPGRVTAQGHVVVVADTPTMRATFTDDEFILFVSDKLEPLSLKFSGSPGKTTAKAKDGTR